MIWNSNMGGGKCFFFFEYLKNPCLKAHFTCPTSSEIYAKLTQRRCIAALFTFLMCNCKRGDGTLEWKLWIFHSIWKSVKKKVKIKTSAAPSALHERVHAHHRVLAYTRRLGSPNTFNFLWNFARGYWVEGNHKPNDVLLSAFLPLAKPFPRKTSHA